jgi:putative ABC transport system ATP-binding protein
MAYIELKDVKKTYHVGEIDIQALDGVNMEIDKGQMIIVAGASGAGKSTILNILGGMDTCTSGKIAVDGNRVDQMNEKKLTSYRRYDIGFVFQFYNLVQNLTALENVELAIEICRDPLDPAETLKQVGLEERMNNFPAQLSGGEQQRVAIARALAKNPKLLLCDEPTGALDYVTGKQILKLLQKTSLEHHMTVVIITHNLALCPMGDKVFHVKNGKIISMETNDHPQDIDTIEW